MFETILGGIFIISLFLFTAYGLPKMGYRIGGKRIYRDYKGKLTIHPDTTTLGLAKDFKLKGYDEAVKRGTAGNMPFRKFILPKDIPVEVTGGHGDSKCLCHCHNGHGGCFGMVVDGKEYSHVYCVEKCTHCSQEKNRP